MTHMFYATCDEGIEEQIDALRDLVVERAREEEGNRFLAYATSGWRWDPVYGVSYGDPEQDFCVNVDEDDTVRVFAAGLVEDEAVIPGAYAQSCRAETAVVLDELNSGSDPFQAVEGLVVAVDDVDVEDGVLVLEDGRWFRLVGGQWVTDADSFDA